MQYSEGSPFFLSVCLSVCQLNYLATYLVYTE